MDPSLPIATLKLAFQIMAVAIFLLLVTALSAKCLRHAGFIEALRQVFISWCVALLIFLATYGFFEVATATSSLPLPEF